MLLSLFACLSLSAIDKLSLTKEILEIPRFQHQSGGFYDQSGEANARDTFRAIHIAKIHGLLSLFHAKNTFRYALTLHNRDGGCGSMPGRKSTISATFHYFYIMYTLAPDQIDTSALTDFLQSRYEYTVGLFKETPESQPSIEATYYAYRIVSHFDDSNLNWLYSYELKSFLQDHIKGDHFEFEDVPLVEAQVYGTYIARAISMTLPTRDLQSYIFNYINKGIKNNDITIAQVGELSMALTSLGSDSLPPSVNKWLTVNNTLGDLFYITVITQVTREVNSMYDVQIMTVTSDNQYTNVERDGVVVNQLIKPAVSVVSLQRFFNPFFHANITMKVADDDEVFESLRMDYQTGLYTSQRLQQVDKLGQFLVEVVLVLPSTVGPPVVITKQVNSRTSIPLLYSFEASDGEEMVFQYGDIHVGTSIKAVASLRQEADIEVAEGTMSSLTVRDSSGTVLFFEKKPFSSEIAFSYEFKEEVVPSGEIKVTLDIGDSSSGVHTSYSTSYNYASTMAASNIIYDKGVKLGELFKVSMVPGIISTDGFVAFKEFSVGGGNEVDVSGVPLFLPSSSESHKYFMDVKCGGSLVRRVEGTVSTSGGKLLVSFETNIDDTVDFVTGFSIEFSYSDREGRITNLRQDSTILIELPSKISAKEATNLRGGNLRYGDQIEVKFKLFDSISKHELRPGRAYPVIRIVSNGNVYSQAISTFTDESPLVSAKISIDASIPKGDGNVEVVILKGTDIIPIILDDGSKYSSKIKISEDLKFTSNVVQSGDTVVIDYYCSYGSRSLSGGFFEAHIMTYDGQTKAVVQLTQMAASSRLSWLTNGAKGSYTVDLYRVGDSSGKPLLQTKISIEGKIATWFSRLPIEGISLHLTFLLFAWSIRLRMQFRKVPLR